MALKTYDLKDVICTYGPHRFKGFDEGPAITLTPVEDIYKEKVGADGETTRARTNNNNYEASIKLMGNSSIHLQMINTTFRNSALNGVTFPFQLISIATGETYTCANAYVKRLPTCSKSKQPKKLSAKSAKQTASSAITKQKLSASSKPAKSISI